MKAGRGTTTRGTQRPQPQRHMHRVRSSDEPLPRRPTYDVLLAESDARVAALRGMQQASHLPGRGAGGGKEGADI